jgi:hypothetical protein
MKGTIPDWLKTLYVCYLGKNKGIRLDAIIAFAKHHNGREFFDRFSMPGDSIIEFLKKCEKAGLDL